MDVIGTIKENPILVLGGVAVILLIAKLGSGGSTQVVSSGSNNSAYALQSQQIASAANVTLGTVNAQESSVRAGISADMFKTQAQLSAQNKQSDNQTFVSVLMGLQGNSTAKYIADAELSGLRSGQQQSANIAALTVGADIEKARLSTMLGLTGLNVTEKLGTQANANQERVIANETKQIDLAGANYSESLQHTQAMAVIGAQSSYQLSQLNSTTMLGLADKNNKTQVDLLKIQTDSAYDISKLEGYKSAGSSILGSITKLFGL